MRKHITKILAYSISLSMIFGCFGIATTEAAYSSNNDGDVVENPWQ